MDQAKAENFFEIKTEKDFNRICLHNFDKLYVVLFYAEWHEPSKHLINVVKSLSKVHEGNVIFFVINADEVEALASSFSVEVVPTILFMKATKEVMFRLEEDSPSTLSQKVDEYLNTFKITFEAQKSKIFPKIEELIRSSPLFIFIKGTPANPKCGFSEQLIQALNELKVKYSSFDILSDEELRNWLRYYSNWVTYPQVYLEGKFIGGLDITRGLIKEGKFQEMIKHLNIKDEPKNIVERILQSGNVIALIEGKVTEPSTLKSEEMVRILNENGVRFSSYDITTADEELIKVLKETVGADEFPYLVVEKKGVGNLKTVKELSESKELQSKIPKEDLVISINEKLKQLINSSPVMVFMKGTPESPECGFSRRMVELLFKHNVKFGYFNILADKVVRERLKEYSNWKTYPQLYVEGKLIGGLDIALELDSQGEFVPLVEKYIQ